MSVNVYQCTGRHVQEGRILWRHYCHLEGDASCCSTVSYAIMDVSGSSQTLLFVYLSMQRYVT
jgi:hypothetical protein